MIQKLIDMDVEEFVLKGIFTMVFFTIVITACAAAINTFLEIKPHEHLNSTQVQAKEVGECNEGRFVE